MLPARRRPCDSFVSRIRAGLSQLFRIFSASYAIQLPLSLHSLIIMNSLGGCF